MNDPVTVPEWVLLNALRYALGRHSYVVSDTIDLVRRHWPHASENFRTVAQRDIDEHLAYEDRRALTTPASPVEQIDTRAWRALANDLRT